MKTTQVALSDLCDHVDALNAKFGPDDQIAYINVTMTQLSVARHFRRVEVNGKLFVYNASDDSLIRDDVVRFVRELKRETGKK